MMMDYYYYYYYYYYVGKVVTKPSGYPHEVSEIYRYVAIESHSIIHAQVNGVVHLTTF